MSGVNDYYLFHYMLNTNNIQLVSRRVLPTEHYSNCFANGISSKKFRIKFIYKHLMQANTYFKNIFSLDLIFFYDVI